MDFPLAYLDPGSGSMIVQLIVGGIAAAGVAAKLYWNKLMRLLRIKKAEPTASSPKTKAQPAATPAQTAAPAAPAANGASRAAEPAQAGAVAGEPDAGSR